MTGTPTPRKNLVTIRLPPFAPKICENEHQVTRLVFTALHGMQTRYSDEKAVRLSVCL